MCHYVLQLKLSKRYRVKGIPVLVFVDADSGTLITDNGRQAVVEDPEGKSFPWYPEPLSSILYSGPLLRCTDEVDSEEVLQNKVKGIYFSAHWVCNLFKGLLIYTLY